MRELDELLLKYLEHHYDTAITDIAKYQGS